MYATFMDLKKAYNKVDWNALWDVLKIYDMRRRLYRAIQTFYRSSSACIQVKAVQGDNFEVKI